jgi:RNA polymerase sigma-54 factor
MCGAFTLEKDLPFNIKGMTAYLSQGLQVTPSLRLSSTLTKAIELLALNSVDLTDRINQYMSDNPFLEYECGEGTGLQSDAYGDLSITSRYQPCGVHDVSFENFLPYTPSSYEQLENQLGQILTPHEKSLIPFLFEHMHERGFLEVPIIACVEKKMFFEKVRGKLIKNITPVGLFSYHVVECFYHQLVAAEAPAFLLNQLKPFAMEESLSKEAMIEVTRIMSHDACLMLKKHLNPDPLSTLEAPSISQPPDAFAEKQGEQWVLQLNPFAYPTLSLNEILYKKAKNYAHEKNQKAFNQTKYHEAQWLLRSLEKRKTSFEKVLRYLLTYQEKHMCEGATLKPLMGKEIAEALSMHESTISRIVQNKVVVTPYGHFSLKKLFSHGVVYAFHSATPSNRNIMISKDFIMKRIHSLIQKEDKHHPFSDEALTQRIQAEGIELARRTVAKYRTLMGIPVAGKRKALTFS